MTVLHATVTLFMTTLVVKAQLPTAIQFLEDNDVQQRIYCNKMATALWNYYTNITEETNTKLEEAGVENALFTMETSNNATLFEWQSFEHDDPLMFQWFKSLVGITDKLQPGDKEDLFRLQDLVSIMTDVYTSAKVCEQGYSCKNPTLELDPDLKNIMATSRDYEELKRVWIGWRNATGRVVRPPFTEYVQLTNNRSKLNGFEDAGDEWRKNYGDGFQDIVESLWNDIRPLYLQLHTYVRNKLREQYPRKINPDGPIPAHVLGQMYGETWLPIYDIVQPYGNTTLVNVTQAMIDTNMTVLQMFEIANNFFVSLGLREVPPSFWKKSVMEKPKDRNSLCYPFSIDLCLGDVRINMCTQVKMDDLITVHHEMGHIQYFMQYENLPYVFHSSVDPGFHEAVGDALALSVLTPTYMKQIGLLDEMVDSYEADINYLMQIALNKIPAVSYAYLLDFWRWNVFSGNTSQDRMNADWWRYTLEYQGLCPPVKRTEEDLDAATMFHVVADVPYIRYFVSLIVQFQIHKALCKEAGFDGPLFKCNLYNSKKAGQLFSEVLSKGNQISTREALSILTHGETDRMDASGLLEYFQSLKEWLEKQNEQQTIRWISDDSMQCPV